jgi:hypothetical protein
MAALADLDPIRASIENYLIEQYKGKGASKDGNLLMNITNAPAEGPSIKI